MADKAAFDLIYGHFGQPAYDTETKEWIFNRQPGIRKRLQILRPFKPAISPSESLSNASTLHERSSTQQLKDQTQGLTRKHPELTPASALLSDLARSSNAITSAVTTYDPAVGDLLSYGNITGEHRKRGISVAATASGDAGNILRITWISETRCGWGDEHGADDRSVWLTVPAFEDEAGYWVGDGAPIQQVCFAASEEAPNFLAVRLPTKTVIFRPVYTDARATPQSSKLYALPASSINPHPILTVTDFQTGGSAHADVCFNPWYQRQIGFIDGEGGWSVWDIDGTSGSHYRYALSAANKGTLHVAEDEKARASEENQANPREDGWARILWVGDVNTVLVCNRRKMDLFDIRGKFAIPTELECPEVIPLRSAEWILDVKSSPRDRHRVFVLTSTRLLLLGVCCLDQSSDAEDGKAGASILIAWRHFRDSEDITLQLSLLDEDDEENQILVYSRLNTLITVFRVSVPREEASLPTSVSDPIELRCATDLLNANDWNKHIITLHVEKLWLGRSDRFTGSGPGAGYLEVDIETNQLSVCLSDLSIHQALLYTLPPRGSQSDAAIELDPISWEKKDSHSLRRHRGSAPYGDDGFLVPDRMSLGSLPKRAGSSGQSRAMVRRQPSLSHLRLTQQPSADPWTIDFEFILKEMPGLSGASAMKDLRTEGAEDITTTISRLHSMFLSDEPMPEEPFGTLFDSTGPISDVKDIDEASSILHNLFQLRKHSKEGALPNSETTLEMEVQRIAPQTVLQLSKGGQENPTVASVYNSILHQFIAPLPTEVQGRLRLVQERLARRVAAEVMLASSRIRRVEPDPGAVETQSQPSRGGSITLPILPSRKGKEREASVFSDYYSQLPSSSLQPMFSLPTPEPTLSLVSGTTFTSLSAQGDDPISRLKQHLQISKPSTPIPPSVEQVILHWRKHLGQEPANYDWNATTESVRAEVRVDEEEMSASRRARLQRKAERHLKRQRREMDKEAEARAAQTQPLSMQESTMTRSSPGPQVMQNPTSSQPTQFGGFGPVASQVEKGAFGGRPPAKKTKKMPGFR